MSLRLATRLQAVVSPSFTRSVVNRAALRPVPSPRGSIDSPEAFLKAIGRKSETKLTGVETWEQLWQTDGLQLKKAGLAVKDRRYILWSLEKFRQGEDPEDFCHEQKPPKKIRGRGPAVQFGKRIRSRRHR